jgi:hypothetical protein
MALIQEALAHPVTSMISRGEIFRRLTNGRN